MICALWQELMLSCGMLPFQTASISFPPLMAAHTQPVGCREEFLPPVRVYDLRHRFATAVLNSWLDEKQDIHSRLPYLRTYMGHKDIESTAYYIHLLPENLVKSAGIDWESMGQIFPRAELWEN